MSDVDLSEFYRHSQPKKPPCKVGIVIGALKPAEQKQLTAALETDNNIITSAAIIKWCESRNPLPLISNNVVSHRKGTCTCAK